jgi:large subunit ribosomal protein L20
MARIKRGVTSHAKHKKVLKLAKGYRGRRSKLIKTAREAVLHAGEYAFTGRKDKKGDFRQLWITRINGSLKTKDLSYSKFINLLKSADVQLDRKMLAKIALEDPKTFDHIVSTVSK